MQPFLFLNAIFQLFTFILVNVFFFYVPGTFILSKLRLKLLTPEKIVLPVGIGIALFTLATYLTSWLNVPLLIYLPLVVIFLLSRPRFYPVEKKHFVPFIIVGILSLLFSLPRTLNGIWGNAFSYGGDDVLHMSYMNELRAHFPPDNPAFAGTRLLGYHFFSDFFVAKINELSGIPIESLYYHFVPLLVVGIIGFGIYSLVFAWTKKVSAGLWAVFLVEFGGSFGFILRLQGHVTVSLSGVFGIDQPAAAMLNSPYAFSLAIMTIALLLVYHFSESKNIRWLWIFAVVVGISPLFKIYAGIVLFGGFAALVLVQLLQKHYAILPPFLAATAIALGTYGVFSGSGNYITFFPLWPPHRMLQANLPWYGYDEKVYTYSRLQVTRGLVEVEFYGLFLFLIGNLGTRILGVLVHAAAWIRRRKLFSLFSLTLVGMAATSILIPLFFIQSVKVFEMIQMTWYYPFFVAIAAGYGFALLGYLPTIIRWVLIVAMILSTIPSTYEIYAKYVFTTRTRTPLSYFAPYHSLRAQGTYNDTVLELPPGTIENSQEKIIAWFRISTSRFAAFANRRSYFNSLEIDFPNMDTGGRAKFLQHVRELLAEKKTDTLFEELKARNIRYLWSPEDFPVLNSSAHFQSFYAKPSAFIWRVAS